MLKIGMPRISRLPPFGQFILALAGRLRRFPPLLHRREERPPDLVRSLRPVTILGAAGIRAGESILLKHAGTDAGAPGPARNFCAGRSFLPHNYPA